MAEAKKIQIPAALVTNIGTAASGIVSSLLTVAAGATLDTLKPQISGYVGRNEQLAYMFKGMDLSDVYIPVEDRLETDYKFIVDAIKAGIGQGVGNLHASLFEQLAGTGALLQSYVGQLEVAGIDPYLSRYWNNEFRANIPNAETAWFMQRVGKLTPSDYAAYLAQNGWDEKFKEALEWTWVRQPPLEMLFDLTRRGKISVDDLKYAMRYYRYDDGKIEPLTALLTQYPEPYRLADMSAKGLISDKTYNDTMAVFGLDATWSDMWRQVQYQYPDYGTLLALWRRNVITDKDFDSWLRLSGMPSEPRGMLQQLKDVIPPIQDLIRFAVREAYLDHDPEKQYPFMVDVAKKMGLTEEASSWYWWAHWDRIPVNLMYANYYRGYGIRLNLKEC